MPNRHPAEGLIREWPPTQVLVERRRLAALAQVIQVEPGIDDGNPDTAPVKAALPQFFAPCLKRSGGKIIKRYLRRTCRVCPRRAKG